MIDAYVPPQLFYNGKVDYFDLQRLGGLLSHLKKTLKGLENKLDFLTVVLHHPGSAFFQKRKGKKNTVGKFLSSSLWVNEPLGGDQG